MGSHESRESIQIQPQEMGGAGDARIVVADRLLAESGQRLLGALEVRGDDFCQVVLDGRLVLGGRRYDLRAQDRPDLVDGVAVIEDAARRLGAAEAGARTRWNRDR